MSSKSISKYLGISISVLVIFLGTANFALAQTPPNPSGATLNTKEYQEVLNLINQARRAYGTKKQDLLSQAEAKCLALKPQMEAISNKKQTMTWYKPVLIGAVGSCVPTANTSNRNQQITPKQTALGATLSTTTKPVISQDEYQKIDADAEAGNDVLAVSQLVGYVLDSILGVLTAAVLAFSSFAGLIFSWTLSYTTSDIQPETVKFGWEIVRDVMNMFFVVAMIVMALATILQIESYNYKKLLAKLIIMALLINFSKVIAESLISVSDMVTSVFVADAKLSDWMSHLSGIITSGEGVNGFFAGGDKGALNALAKGILQLMLALIMLISFLALALLLLIRLVGLWVLIIMSPIAYALYILPATEEYAKKWWTTFIKYLIWAPVAVFFLRLGEGLIQARAQPGKSLTGDSNFDFIFISAFMWAAVLVAKQAGMVGSEAIVSLADKGMKGVVAAPFKGAWAGSKALGNYAGEKILERYGKEFRPKKWIEGWKESRDINRAKREAAGMLKAEGKSTLANPTAFFQRYASWKGAVKKGIFRGNKRGAAMMREATSHDEEAKKAEEKANLAAKPFEDEYNRKKALGITDNYLLSQAKRAREPFQADIDKHRGEASRLRDTARHMVHDPDYFTQRKTREAVNHEKATVLGETWQELFDLAEGAHAEKHADRYLALFEKLAETYNENELITHTRYSKTMLAKDSAEWQDEEQRAAIIARAKAGGADAIKADAGDFDFHQRGEFFHEDRDGIENFRKQILEEDLKMSEEASMRFMADIGELAAAKNHTGIWRLYNTKNGKWRRNPYEDWDAEMRIEKGKMQVNTKLATANRLHGHDEYTSPNYEVDETRIALTQENEIEDTINLIDNVKFLINRGQFNASKARALAFKPNMARLKAYAEEHLKDETKYEALDLKGRNIMEADGKTKKMWTKKDEALYTLEELRKFGDAQYKGNEKENHEKVLEQLLKTNKISERHREYMKKAGLTNIGSATV